jgi:CheY-like chemotaxis protein
MRPRSPDWAAVCDLGGRWSGLGSSAVGERSGELFARLDVEFAIAVGKVHLDGAERDEEGLRDLLVGVALGGELDDAELGGGEGVAAGLCDATGAGAGEAQLVARVEAPAAGSILGGGILVLPAVRPEVVLMDIRMPGLDGIIFMKLDVRDRAAAIVFAYDHGVVSAGSAP